MSLSFRVLGQPGRDNALWVRIDTGQQLSQLLFDCGEGCLADFSAGDLQAIDHLFFSHLHMDHVAGFDTFFRCTYDRSMKPNRVWGPSQTAATLHHRFQGYRWNLHHDLTGTWHVADIHPDTVRTYRSELAEAFAHLYPEAEAPNAGPLVHGPGFTVQALLMDHGTPSVAYVVRETPRSNIDPARLAARGWKPGPWLKALRDPNAEPESVVDVGGTRLRLAELRQELVQVTPGESIAYLTDFLMDEPAMGRLTEALRGVSTVVCESQYRPADLELARRNCHMTATQPAELARRAGVGQLVLFHVSDRYRPPEWEEMLREAQAVFPATRFPEHWRL